MSVVKLTQPQQERLRRLLHMEYTVTELSQELGCKRRVIERAIEAGVPHRVAGNRTWIVGDVFADWWYSRLPQRKTELAEDEAYCLRCRGARKFRVEEVHPNSPGVERVVGECEECGAKVHRLRKMAVSQ